jgi:hypothetical protein
MKHCSKKCQCKEIQGIVQSGVDWSKRPLSNMNVQLFFASFQSKTFLIGHSITNQQGEFQIYISNDKCYQNGLFYLIATNRFDSFKKFMLLIGDQIIDEKYVINERSTISAIYCSSQFYNRYQGQIVSKSNQLVLKIMGKMNLNIIQYDGKLSEIIKFSPNGDETNSMRLLNSLSNL